MFIETERDLAMLQNSCVFYAASTMYYKRVPCPFSSSTSFFLSSTTRFVVLETFPRVSGEMDKLALKESCEKILSRLQQKELEDYTCFLCRGREVGQDRLMEHIITRHHIHLAHFDNVVDLRALLAFLQDRIHHSAAGSEAHALYCPVCADAAGSSEEQFVEHVADKGHQHWNGNTITGLSDYYICVRPEAAAPEAESGSSGSSSFSGSDDGDADAFVPEDEHDADALVEEAEPCECLYCSAVSQDVLGHMREAHQFDFTAATRARDDVHDEYDLIRLVNAVRRCVVQRKGACCPGHDAREDGDADKEACRAAIAACGSLETHLREHPSHRLPVELPTGDASLLPVLPGDAFISLLVTYGEGFLQQEEADPDFPMVPTIHEIATNKMPPPPTH
ncbi:Zinc finger Transcription Factor family member (ztf-7) [Strigomonas culicis]|uniref:Zinc finger Transcription Factor family member (Ztf-7) n=1 Tax=Strigomonas culicis TaxID=28005 RepID=S9TS22_9TRYP|nr:Zinc finger Transcription Factor family member (ztf-7) [Strigomonas culicis]|eukprot:EPY21162.1 Zinc finger Transcription Factor family member (ztf-7) [Strigomonas culicis]